MTEHKIPIPAMLYNAAVGGHVTNSQQIIDEVLNKEQSVINVEQQELNKGILEEKEYTSGSNNGMGRVVLRKNMVNGVNTLTQSMINKSNTIYIIQYDFTLGEDITVPENCVLEFEGGSINGAHTITGTNTGIRAKETDTIFAAVLISGTWDVKDIYATWFSDVEETDRIHQVFNLTSPSVYNNVYIPKDLECEITSLNSDGGIAVKDNTYINLDGTIKLQSNSITINRIINCTNSSNIIIKGIGSVVGDRDSHTGTDGEYQHGIWLENSHNVIIDGLTVTKCMGDCISVGGNTYPSSDVIIKNCDISYARRCGISIASVDRFEISNCNIHNNSGGWQSGVVQVEAAIDVELNAEDIRQISNGIIKNNTINNKYGIFVTSTEANNGPENIIIINNNITAEVGGVICRCAKNVNIRNNKFFGSSATAISINAGNASQTTNYGSYFIENNIIVSSGGDSITIGGDDSIVTNNIMPNQLYVEGSKYINGVKLIGNTCGNLRSIASNFVTIERNTINGTFFCVNNSIVLDNIIKNTIGRIGGGSIFRRNTVTIAVEESGIEPIVLEDDIIFEQNIINFTGSNAALSFLKINRRDNISNNIFKAATNPSLVLTGGNDRFGEIIFKDNICPIYTIELENVKIATLVAPVKGTFANKPTAVPVGHRYFCTDKQTTEGATNGIEIIHKGNGVWVDALGRTVS